MVTNPRKAPLQHLRPAVFSAALTSGGGEIVTRVAAVALSIMTARILEPAQVGILGIAAITIGLISIIGYYVEIAAVANGREEPDAAMALAATVIRAAIIVTLAGAVALAFPLIGARFAGGAEGARLLAHVTSAFALTLFFEMLSGYPSIILQRGLDLAPIAAIQFAQAIVALAVAALLLSRGFGPVGVSWANVAGSAATTALLWSRLLRRGYARPSPPSRVAWRTTLRGTGSMFIGLFGGFLSERFDNLLVAGAIGPRPMSFYSMAWNASHTPANVFSRAINFVLVPALAHIRDDVDRTKRALRECLRYSYVLLAPVCATFVIAASEIITIVLGAKWLPAATPLRIMATSVLTAPMLFVCTAVLVGAGRAQWTGISTAIHLVVLALIIPPLARAGGVQGAAFGELIAIALLTVTVFTTARMVTGLVTMNLLIAPLLPIAAAVAGGVLAWFLAADVRDLWLRVALKGVVLGIAYAATLALIARETHLKGLIGLVRALISGTRPTGVANA